MISLIWIGLAAGLVAIAALAAVFVFLRRKRPLKLVELLDRVAIDQVHDVVIPDDLDGQIHVEYLLLTVRGIVVMEVKEFAGIVFAGERIDEWTVRGRQRRFSFRNPLPALRDRVAAVRQLAPGVSVAGHVLFAVAEFGKDRPAEVLLPDELLERYGKFELRDTERLTEAYWPHWERVRAAAAPADSPSVGRL